MANRNNDNNRNEQNLDNLKGKLAEQMPDVDLNNMTNDDMKNMLMDQINNNKNINLDDSIKEKINQGDAEGIKSELIELLSKNKSGDSSNEQLAEMLKNNDMEGVKNHLFSALLSGGFQKKNEPEADKRLLRIEEKREESRGTNRDDGKQVRQNMLSNMGFDEKMIMNMLRDKMFSGASDDNRVALLNSMKPFLSEKRQKGVDECIKLLSMAAFFGQFNNKK